MKTYMLLIIFSSSLFTFSALAENAKQDSSLPPVVTPGVYGNPDKVGKAASDAIVLFDGTNFDQGSGCSVRLFIHRYHGG